MFIQYIDMSVVTSRQYLSIKTNNNNNNNNDNDVNNIDEK